jgi:hypothetical protein
MIQYVIHNKNGLYLPKTNDGYWTNNIEHAKKYMNKPAMFKKLIKIMERNPKDEFYFETLHIEITSKGSHTLGSYNRIKKVKSITSNINRKEKKLNE